MLDVFPIQTQRNSIPANHVLNLLAPFQAVCSLITSVHITRQMSDDWSCFDKHSEYFLIVIESLSLSLHRV